MIRSSGSRPAALVRLRRDGRVGALVSGKVHDF